MHSVYMDHKDGVSIVNIKGRIDASNSGQIHERIMDEIEQGNHKIVVNFSEVSYISSAGLRILVYASKALAKNKGLFSICSVNSNIEKIFQISGLSSLFDICEDLDASLKFVKGETS